MVEGDDRSQMTPCYMNLEGYIGQNKIPFDTFNLPSHKFEFYAHFHVKNNQIHANSGHNHFNLAALFGVPSECG
jgi:hypothetical protein